MQIAKYTQKCTFRTSIYQKLILKELETITILNKQIEKQTNTTAFFVLMHAYMFISSVSLVFSEFLLSPQIQIYVNQVL